MKPRPQPARGYAFVRITADADGQLVQDRGIVRELVELDAADRPEALLVLARGVNDRGRWVTFVRARERDGSDLGLVRYSGCELADGAPVERVLESIDLVARRAFDRLLHPRTGNPPAAITTS